MTINPSTAPAAGHQMRVANHHERLLNPPPERIAPLIADLGRIWPVEIAAAPRWVADRRYQVGPMLWEECDHPGALRAFRVLEPDELRLEHWFGLESVPGATVLSHVIEGYAVGRYRAIWRERIEPSHDLVIEALFDKVEAAIQTWVR